MTLRLPSATHEWGQSQRPRLQSPDLEFGTLPPSLPPNNAASYWKCLHLLLMTFGLMPCASAQSLISGSTIQTVSGSTVGLTDAESHETTWAPVLLWQSVFTGTVVQVRPRSVLAADGRLTVALDPAAPASTTSGTTSENSGSFFSNSALRLQPELGGLATLAPVERFRLGLFVRSQASLNLSGSAQGLSSNSTAGDDAAAGNPDGNTSDGAGSTDPGLGGDTSATDNTGGISSSGLLGRLTRLPDNTGWVEGGLSLQPLMGDRWGGHLMGSYRLLRPFACQDTPQLDPSLALTASDAETRSWTTTGQLTHKLTERVGLSVVSTLRLEDSLPWQECPESTVSAQRYQLFTPALGLDFALETGGIHLQGGVTTVGSRALAGASAGASAGGSSSFDVRPVLMLDAQRRFGWGQLVAKTGAEVVTLLGQSTPTYNRLLELGGRWEPEPRWSLFGGVGLVRSLPLTLPFAEIEESGNGMRALLGQLKVAWTPHFWIRTSAGYSLTARQVIDGSSTPAGRFQLDSLPSASASGEVPDTVATDGKSVGGVIVHAVMAHLTVTFDPRTSSTR